MDIKKLTPEELQEFQNNRQDATRLAENIKEAIKANALKQRDQLKELGAKYGDGTINPENGEITLLSV